MPLFPPNSTIYDPVSMFLNSARTRLNDELKTLIPTSGRILGEGDPASNQRFNNAYRRLQDGMCDCGAERFQQEIIIFGIPPVQNQDPASQCYINWFNCFDGSFQWTQPVLPSNLILPSWMAERPSGNNSVFPPPELPNMRQTVDGLPMQAKQQRNGCWEWRDDTIYFPGATTTVDFRIRFSGYLSDIVDSGTTRWFQQSVPIMRCLDALSWWICVEFADARAADGDATEQMAAASDRFRAKAMDSTRMLTNRDSMQLERADVRRIPYAGGSRGQGVGGGWR